ncbi:hypothetical protein GCM10020001_106660 [Nonomuraea salmonea]
MSGAPPVLYDVAESGEGEGVPFLGAAAAEEGVFGEESECYSSPEGDEFVDAETGGGGR